MFAPSVRQCQKQSCGQNCEFGYVLDSHGCETCVCIDPCVGVKCNKLEVCVKGQCGMYNVFLQLSCTLVNCVPKKVSQVSKKQKSLGLLIV